MAEKLTHKRIGIPAGIALVLLMGLVCLFCFRTVSEVDIGYHLAGGEWILENGRVPDTDMFTFTVPDHAYLDLHWAYQVLVFGLHRVGGFPGLVAVHAAAVVLAFGIMILTALRRNGPPVFLAVVTLAGILAAEFRFSIRPEVFSWVLLVLMILALEKYRETRRWPWMLAVPAIMAVWVNIQGIFIVGLLTAGAYALGESISLRKPDRPLILGAVAGFAACFLNPYGIRGVMFPLTLMTRLGGDNPFARSIAEFQSPWTLNPIAAGALYPRKLLYSYIFLSALLVILFLLTLRKRRTTEWFLAAIFGLLAAQAIRNIPIFVLVCIPLMVRAAGDLLASRPGRKLQEKLPLQPFRMTVGVILTALVLATGVQVLSSAYYISDRRDVRFGYALDDRFLPVQAAAFIGENSLEGRLFNQLRYGGYFIWKLKQPVFIDGRLEVMQEDFFREYTGSNRWGELIPLLDRYHVDIAVFTYATSRAWITDLDRSEKWRLVYFDDISVVYIRSVSNGHVPDVTFPPVRTGNVSIPPDDSQRDRIIRYVQSRQTLTRFEGFFTVPDFPSGDMNRATLARFLHNMPAAESFLLAAVENSGGIYFEPWFNLGLIYQQMNRPDLARICHRNVRTLCPRALENH